MAGHIRAANLPSPLAQFPTVLPFFGPFWARNGQHGGDLRHERPLAVAVPPAVGAYFAAGSCPQVHGSQVQSTHVQFGLSHFLFSVSAISYSFLLGTTAKVADLSIAVLV